MIVKSFANIMSLDHCKANIFGCNYEFILENFENVNGLARCLIKDLTNGETYHSNGYVEINGYSFTTKDFDRVYVSFNPNRKDTNYIYFADKNGCSFKAWENKEDFQAWLRTNRAEVFKGFWDNQYVVWIWKNIEHHVSPTEFDSLDLPEDTFLMNGAIRRCKRKYDEGTHTIHTYYVWYWNDPNKDFYEAATEQNEIREKLYTLDRRTPENQIAKRELATGKVKPIKL